MIYRTSQIPRNDRKIKTVKFLFFVKYSIYGRIDGYQLLRHIPLFFMGTRKIISHGRIGKSKVALLYGSVAI